MCIRDRVATSIETSLESADALLNWASIDSTVRRYISQENINGTIEQLTTDDGNFYAVPFRSDFWVLYYNKDLFDAAGVEYPSNDLTMEDYDALARKMTSGSGDTKVYGCHYHTWRCLLYTSCGRSKTAA